MDEKDFVFLNKPLTEKEEKEFSEFLQSRKKKTRLARGNKKEQQEALKHDQTMPPRENEAMRK